MIKSYYKYISWILPAAVIVLLLSSLIAVPASANPGLNVSGAILVTDTSPGETLTHKVTVSIGDTDPATDITVQVGGMGQSLDGAYELLEAPADTSGHSARQFVAIDKESFHLEPGMSQDLTVTVRIPQDVGAGGRYAVISIMNTRPTGMTGKEGVTTLTGINVPIALTIKDTQLTHQGKITALATEATGEQAFNIFTTFQNTGNHHFKVKGEVTISNSQGEVLDTILMPLTASSIIPTMSRQLQRTYTPEGVLADDIYTVKSRVMLEDGTVLDEKEGGFEIKGSNVSITTPTLLAPPPATTPPATPPATTPAQPAPAVTTPTLPTTPTQPAPATINWPMIGGIIGGVIIVGLLVDICLLVRKRKTY
jgi:hypothetical protein